MAGAESPHGRFEAGCRRGVLLYQTDGQRAVFPPRVLPGLEWRESAGLGTVYATTTIRPRGGEPRNVSLIDLDEGFRMMSRTDAPIGARVQVAFEEGVPVFPGVVIAGIGEADFHDVPEGTRPEDLMGQAAIRALDDAGLTTADVDGLFAAATQLTMPTLSAGAYLGIQPRYTDATQIGGSSFIAHLNHAAAAIETGRCEVALIVYGSTQRLVGRAGASVQEIDPYEAPYEPMNPVTAYGLAAARHMHEFGTTPEQLAEVAVSARRWAQRNPNAWSRDELTIDDVLAAPRVCDPLGVRDCCLVTDGGAAAVLTRGNTGVTLLGAGEAHTHRHVSTMPDLTRTAAVESGARAFAQAGLTPGDVDVLQLYDAFTITPILFLEDLGFCAKGEGGAYVEGGRTAPGGAGLPMNTNGGGLSFCHPGMYGLLAITEAVRRLRETNDRIALVHGNGGVLSSQATALLGLV